LRSWLLARTSESYRAGYKEHKVQKQFMFRPYFPNNMICFF